MLSEFYQYFTLEQVWHSVTPETRCNRFKNEVRFFSESFINLEAPSLKIGEENGMFKFDVK